MRMHAGACGPSSPSSRRAGRPTYLAGAALAALAVAFASMAPANATSHGAPNDQAVQSSGSQDPASTRINHALDTLARLLALSLDDENVRRQIHDAVAERFDGDFDVLYKSLASNSGVPSALAAAYGRARAVDRSEAVNGIARLAGEIPRFQVAVPANFGQWDPQNETPLVAFLPAGVEDTELKTVTAYDIWGIAHLLDAQIEPDQPVIVLGMNERTDDAGRLLRRESPAPSGNSGATGPAQMVTTALASTAYQVRMVEVTLIDDNEPWVAGDAEIYLKAKSVASSATCGTEVEEPNWPNLNNSGDAWSGPKTLGNTCADVIFYWWEDDGGNFDFTLSYGGISLGSHMDNGDDLIGGIRLAYSSFSGASMENYRWTDLSQWTD